MKIGLIGLGEIVNSVHLPILLNLPSCEIDWFFDTNMEASIRVKKNYKLKSVVIFDDIKSATYVDILVVCIPVGVRLAVLNQLSFTPKVIFFEKPAAFNLENFREINAYLSEKNIIGYVGMQRRFYKGTNTLKNIIDTNCFGSPKKIIFSEGTIMRGFGLQSSTYRSNYNISKGGVLLETGSHLLDQFEYIFNGCNKTIKKVEFQKNEQIDLDVKVLGDCINSKWNYQCVFEIELSWIKEINNRIVIEYDSFNISLSHSVNGKLQVESNNKKILELVNGNFNYPNTAYDAYSMEWIHILRSIEEKDNSILNYSAVESSIKFINKIYEFK